MYTLRTFTENSEVNNSLGRHYEVVRREESYERFSELYLQRFGKHHVADLDKQSSEETKRCYAILVTYEEEQIPLFKGQSNYIVTDSGKTFSNLTFK